MLSQRIRNRYYKTLGTSVINSPMSAQFLTHRCCNHLCHTVCLSVSLNTYYIPLTNREIVRVD